MGKKRIRRKFSNEFKTETIKLIQTSGLTVGTVAKELGILDSVVRRWLQQAEADGSTDYRALLARQLLGGTSYIRVSSTRIQQ